MQLTMELAFGLYNALSSDLAIFIPVAYCRLMLGDEHLFLRVPLAAAFGLFALWLFSWRGEGGWNEFNTVMVALAVSLLRRRHATTAGRIAAAFGAPGSALLLSGGVGLVAIIGRPLAYHLFPIEELALAYSTAQLFAGAALEPAAARLALIAITSQLPLGTVNTSSLRAAQRRKNALLTVGKEGAAEPPPFTARDFTRMVAGFIAFTAVPYFLQRSVPFCIKVK